MDKKYHVYFFHLKKKVIAKWGGIRGIKYPQSFWLFFYNKMPPSVLHLIYKLYNADQII